MILEGEPAILPWTTASARAAALPGFKPRAGGAPLSAGKTFSRAVASVRQCAVAALDVQSGYVVASSDLTLRDDVLALLQADTARVARWFRITASEVPTHALFEFDAGPDDLPAARSFGELYSLGERLDAWLARTESAIPRGFILWIGGSGTLEAPLPDGSIQPEPLPALCLYGCFADAGSVATLSPGFDALSRRLLSASAFDESAATMFAAACDRETFRLTVGSAEAVLPGDLSPTELLRLGWLANILPTPALEDVKGLPWEAKVAVESNHPFAAVALPGRLQDEDGELVTGTSQFTLEDVPIELAAAQAWWCEETGEPITDAGEGVDLVNV